MADLADSSDTQGTVTAMEISNSLDVTQPEDYHGCGALGDTTRAGIEVSAQHQFLRGTSSG